MIPGVGSSRKTTSGETRAVIKATSILGDLFQFTGDYVKIFANSGGVQGPGGTDDVGFLDTNSTDLLQQWDPTLIKMTGKSCKVSRIKVIDPPTIGISVSGLYSKIKDVTIMGGRITHGAGTKNFGIYLDGNAKFSKITGLTVEANGLGGMVYDAIFNSGASDCEFIDNPIGQTLEHAIYNYGDRCIIGQNLIDGLNSSASAIQVFAEGCTISNNTIKNNKSGGIGLQRL